MTMPKIQLNHLPNIELWNETAQHEQRARIQHRKGSKRHQQRIIVFIMKICYVYLLALVVFGIAICNNMHCMRNSILS